MFDSTIGLIVGFILLAATLSWSIVFVRGRIWLKVFSIGALLWYGLAVHFTIPKLMGWSADEGLPPESRILSVQIIEPCATDKGAMYFWMSQEPDHAKDAANLLRPDKVFAYTGTTQPRAFYIPYDRDLHKKLLEARKEQQKVKGSSLVTGKKGLKKGKGKRDGIPDEDPFKILNPFDYLNKEEESE